MKVAVIGYGKQGQRLAKKFHELGVLSLICDTDPQVLAQAEKEYRVRTLPTAEGLEDEAIDAVAISTPTPTHYEYTKHALRQDKDVLVEKPLTDDSEQAEELVDIATAMGCVLTVGHTTLYLDGVEDLRKQRPIYYHSIRTNPDGFRTDDDVLWRLLPHDIALSMYLFGSEPKVLCAAGSRRGAVLSTVVADLQFKGGGIAGLYGSWDVSEKIREIHVYNSGAEMVMLPEMGDPLKAECKHFLRCVETREKPLTDGEFGLKVVRVLEEIERKL